VTNLLRADLLVLLTVVDGLLTSDGQTIDLVPKVDQEISRLARSDRSALGSGGMAGKLTAAGMVSNAGESVIIANGRQRNVLSRLLDGERIGTFFAPAPKKMSARHRWIRSAVRPAGKVVIDQGAADAVLRSGKSLLARGIVRVTGTFERGTIVRLVTEQGDAIAHAVSNYSSEELDKIKGLKSSEIADVLGHKPFDEAIHRDNLVLIAGEQS